MRQRSRIVQLHMPRWVPSRRERDFLFRSVCSDAEIENELTRFVCEIAEIREANCHLRVQNINETCSETLAGYYTRTQCCCSAAAPQGYGTGFCSACPRNGTGKRKRGPLAV